MNEFTDPARWGALVAKSGRDPAAYRVTRHWRRHEGQAAHVLLRLDGPEDSLIWKEIQRPADKAHFAAVVAAQNRAARSLAGHAMAATPAILARDIDSRAMLMEHVDAPTLFALGESAPEDAGPLRLAGVWLSAFHRASPRENRKFQPRFMTEHLGRLVAGVSSGREPIAHAEEFLAAAARVTDMARHAEGAATVSATRHGDAQARNFLIGSGRCWGIDMSPETQGPVGYDIARLLVSWAEYFVAVEELPPGRILPAAAEAAFFAGYDLTPGDDASVAFLMRMRILSNWRALPADPARMSLADLFRLNRMRQLARHALDP